MPAMLPWPMHDVEMPLESRRLHKKLVASRQAFGSNAEQEIMLGGKNYNKKHLPQAVFSRDHKER